MIAFIILLVAVLTMVGYTAAIHKAAKESKRQAQASTEARSTLELLRDSKAAFEQAASPAGYQVTKTEYLLDGEVAPEDNETGNQAATTYEVTGRARPLSNTIYALTVTAVWEEDQRVRQVVLESRAYRPGF